MRFFIKTCVLRTTCYKNDLGITTSTFGGIFDSFNNHHLSKEPCQEKKSMQHLQQPPSSQDREAKKSKLQFE